MVVVVASGLSSVSFSTVTSTQQSKIGTGFDGDTIMGSMDTISTPIVAPSWCFDERTANTENIVESCSSVPVDSDYGGGPCKSKYQTSNDGRVPAGCLDECSNPGLGCNQCTNSTHCSGDRTCKDAWCVGTANCDGIGDNIQLCMLAYKPRFEFSSSFEDMECVASDKRCKRWQAYDPGCANPSCRATGCKYPALGFGGVPNGKWESKCWLRDQETCSQCGKRPRLRSGDTSFNWGKASCECSCEDLLDVTTHRCGTSWDEATSCDNNACQTGDDCGKGQSCYEDLPQCAPMRDGTHMYPPYYWVNHKTEGSCGI